MKRITSIDLFAGAGGMRLGLKNAVHKLGLKHECLFYSEINNWCREVYQNNFPKTKLIADTKNILSWIRFNGLKANPDKFHLLLSDTDEIFP